MSNFGSRQSAVNVRRARFRDRPGTFSHGKPSAFVALRDRCRLPQFSTNPRAPHRRSAPTPVSPLVTCRPAVSLHATTPVPASAAATSLVRTGLRSCGCPSRPVSHRCVPVPAVRTATRDRARLPRDSALQSGCAAFTEAELHQFDVHPRRFFVRSTEPPLPWGTVQRRDPHHQTAEQSDPHLPRLGPGPAARPHRAECAHRLLRTPGHSSPRPSGPRSVDRPLAKTPRESAVRALPNGPDLPPTAPSIPTKPSSIQPGTDQPFPPVIERTAYSVHPRDSLP